jgi:hypothetical protein
MTDEINSSNDSAADAVAGDQPPAATGDTVARAELDKAIARRSAALDKTRELEAANAKLAAELEKLKGSAPPPPSDRPRSTRRASSRRRTPSWRPNSRS